MKNYKELKKIIQEANPELTELKFGSYVTGMGYSNARVIMLSGQSASLNKGNYCIETIVRKDLEENCKWENDICLADVLVAIAKKQQHKANPQTISCNGGFYQEGELMAVWNLKSNNLDNQSEKTKKFLYELLK